MLPQICIHLESMNVTFFGNRAFAIVSKWRWGHPGFEFGPEPNMTGMLIKREIWTLTYAEGRQLWEEGGRDWNYAAISQGLSATLLGLAWIVEEAKEKVKKTPSLKLSGSAEPYQKLDFKISKPPELGKDKFLGLFLFFVFKILCIYRERQKGRKHEWG